MTSRKGSTAKESRGTEPVTFNVTLPAIVKQKGSLWISSCPSLDVVSQGGTQIEAKKNLEEAVQLFLLSCYERGVLDEALKQCGFKSAAVQKPGRKRQSETITVPLYMSATGL